MISETMRMPAGTGKGEADRGKPYLLAVLGCFLIWGLMDFRIWYMVALASFYMFMVWREKSRLRIPWLLEIFPFLGAFSYAFTTFFFRDSLFVNNERGDAMLTGTIWLGLAGSFTFSVTILWTILAFSPRHQPIEAGCHGDPMPMPLLKMLWAVGIFLNMAVVPFAPSSLKVVVISFGDMEVIALAIILYQSLNDIPGFGVMPRRWALVGIGFWAIRGVTSSLFGGVGSVLMCLMCLFSKWLKPGVAVIGIGFILVFAPLVQQVKENVRTENEKVLNAFANNFERIVLGGDWPAYRKGFERFMGRLDCTDMLGRVKSHMDLVRDFANGDTLKHSIFWSLIPRALYPNKPTTGGASELAIKYGDLQVEEGTSVGIGPIAEFYINFGLPGVLIGMSVMGLFYGYVLLRMLMHPIQPLGCMFAALTLSCVLRPETNLADSFGGAVRVLAVWLVLCFYLRRQQRQRFAGGPVLQPPPAP